MKLISETDTGRPLGRVLLHPSLPYAASIDEGAEEVTLWSVEDGATLRRLFGVAKGCSKEERWRYFQITPEAAVAFHPTRDLVAVAGLHQPVEVWSLSRAERVRKLGHTNNLAVLCYSADGSVLLASDCVKDPKKSPYLQKNYTAAYDETGKRVGKVGVGDTVYVAHPGGPFVAYAFNEQGESFVKFLRASGGAVEKYPTRFNAVGDVRGLAFSPNGKLIAVADEDPWRFSLWVYKFPSFHQVMHYNVLREGDVDSDDWVRRFRTRQTPFRADSRAIHFLGLDGSLMVHRLKAEGPARVARAHSGHAGTIDVRHADGLLITGGADGFIKLWDTGRTLKPATA